MVVRTFNTCIHADGRPHILHSGWLTAFSHAALQAVYVLTAFVFQATDVTSNHRGGNLQTFAPTRGPLGLLDPSHGACHRFERRPGGTDTNPRTVSTRLLAFQGVPNLLDLVQYGL